MKAKVSQDGKMAQVVNPFTDIEDVKDFDYANPLLPLTKDHTPGEIVEVRKVWQCRTDYPNSGWMNFTPTEGFLMVFKDGNLPDPSLFREALEVVPIAPITTKEEIKKRPCDKIYDKVEAEIRNYKIGDGGLMDIYTLLDNVKKIMTVYNPEDYER